MKHFLLFVLTTIPSCLSVTAQDWVDPRPVGRVNFTKTTLPIVFIYTDGITIDRYERRTARMKIIYNGEGELNYVDTVAHPGQTINYNGYVALRYRGNTSYTISDKKPFSFRPIDKPLEEGGEKVKVKLLDMPKDNNWALQAPYSDKSMMRDLLAFALSRPWMDYTPQGKFCELVLDGTYYGVYYLSEVVSKGKNRLNLDDPGDNDDALTGGYLLEVDRPDEITYTSKHHPMGSQGNVFTWHNTYFQYKSPDYEDMTPAQVNYIQRQIDAMEDALASDNYTDPENGYAKYLDVTSFIDFQLAQELAHNVDGYRLSSKIYKQRDSRDPRFKMALWDFNLTYGNADYYQGWRTDTWFYLNNDLLNNSGDTFLVPFWWYRLNSDPAYTAKLKKRWAQYRRSNFKEEHIVALIDSMATVLKNSGAVTREEKAWPKWGRYVWPNYYVASSFDDEIAHMKDWIHDRLQWMDAQLDFDGSPLLGDVNDDGFVDVTDVSVVIDMVLGKIESDLTKADINSDGYIDVSDVSMLIDIILNM